VLAHSQGTAKASFYCEKRGHVDITERLWLAISVWLYLLTVMLCLERIATKPQGKKNNMAQDHNTYSWSDYDGESATTTINTVEITAANLDAQQTLLTTLRTALNDITIGVVAKSVLSDIGWDTLAPTTNPFGQREIKWVIIAEDTLGNRFKANEIPTADLSLLTDNQKYIIKNGVVSVDDPDGFVADFKAAYEAVAVSNVGNALVIHDMYQVGRNN